MHHDKRVAPSRQGRDGSALARQAEEGLIRGFGTVTRLPDDRTLAILFGARFEAARDRLRLAVIRNLLSEAQGHRCCHCGRRTDHDGPPGGRPTIEHVVPRHRNGPTSFANCVMSCADCNSRRNHAHLHEETLVDEALTAPEMPFDEGGPGWPGRRAATRRLEQAIPDVVRSIPSDEWLADEFGDAAAEALLVYGRRFLGTALAERQGWRCVGCRTPMAERPNVIGARDLDDPGYGEGGASCADCRPGLQAAWFSSRP